MINRVTIIGAGNLTSSLLTAIHRNRFSYKIDVIDTDKKGIEEIVGELLDKLA